MTQYPWEYSQKLNEDLDNYRKKQTATISMMENIKPWAKFVASFGVFLGLGAILNTWPGEIALPIVCICTAISFFGVSYWLRSTIDGAEARIRNREREVEKAIAAYHAEYEREHAAETKRKEEERKHREAIAEAERQRKEEEENARMREWEENLRKRIQSEELAADKRMSKSELVHEIAQCILPTFKQIVEKVDTEAHMKVRVRLALEVRADSIDYYDSADPQNQNRFDFKEEGIAETLSPILRKALCKALATELRLLILEAFPIDPERQMVQADLEGAVVLKSNVTYVPGREYTAPEYDANSYAYVVILYQASKDKSPRHF